MQTDGLDEIQRRLGYRFQRSSLLIEALTHKSYLNEAKETGELDNERLEFLGDAVLDLVVSEYILSAFPDAAEGELSKLRARLVSEKTLARVAGRIGLGEMLPRYRTIRETGPDHEKLFEVEILIRGERYGVGVGKSKKEAEQVAAKHALEKLREVKTG